jgi:activating signal cointegrator complex subunit 3
MKALIQEVISKFHSKLHPLRLVVRELTGDMQLTRSEAESANVIVTTPEKWDGVTCKSGNDENSLGNQGGLLIIDKVHLLADESGAVIESVVARLHRLVESRQRQVRIVGLTATLPNYQDVATWYILASVGSRTVLLWTRAAETGATPTGYCIGVIAQTRDRFVWEKKTNDVCYDVVVDLLRRGYQVMVFMHSQKAQATWSMLLADRAAQSDEFERLFVTQGKEGLLT